MHSIGLVENGSKAEITDLNLSLIAIDEEVVTLEVPVNYGWFVAVKVDKPFQDL